MQCMYVTVISAMAAFSLNSFWHLPYHKTIIIYCVGIASLQACHPGIPFSSVLRSKFRSMKLFVSVRCLDSVFIYYDTKQKQ